MYRELMHFAAKRERYRNPDSADYVIYCPGQKSLKREGAGRRLLGEPAAQAYFRDISLIRSAISTFAATRRNAPSRLHKFVVSPTD